MQKGVVVPNIDYDGDMNMHFLPQSTRRSLQGLRLICRLSYNRTINQDQWGIIQQLGSTKYADVWRIVRWLKQIPGNQRLIPRFS